MAVDTVRKMHPNEIENYLSNAISSNEGCDVLLRALNNEFSNLLISFYDLNNLLHKQEMSKNNETILTNEEEAGIVKERPEFTIAYMEPTNGIEKELVKIWENFFGIDKVGVNDDFFALGGDSLKATTLLSLVYKKMNVNIPLTEIFKCPTIKEMALFIEMINLDENNIKNRDSVNKERERFQL